MGRSLTILAYLLAASLFGVLATLNELEAEPVLPFATVALHFPPHQGSYSILPVAAVDGDTVRFFWLIPDTARLAFINAPELPSAEGIAAKHALAEMLTTGKPMKCTVHGREKYGRALLELFDDDGLSLGARLVKDGQAVPYR